MDGSGLDRGPVHFIDEVPQMRHDPASNLVFIDDGSRRGCMREAMFRRTIFIGLQLIKEVDRRRFEQASSDAAE